MAVFPQLVDWRRNMNNFYKIQDRRIPREEISTLLFSMGNDISTHSLSMWIKSKTNDEWVVVPRSFCLNSLKFFEENEYYLDKHGVGNKGYLKQIEVYL